MMDWMMGGWIVMMAVFLLLVIALLVLAGWGILRLAQPTPPAAPVSPDDPMAILNRRYAKGEIGREEFERIRSDIAGAKTQP